MSFFPNQHQLLSLYLNKRFEFKGKKPFKIDKVYLILKFCLNNRDFFFMTFLGIFFPKLYSVNKKVSVADKISMFQFVPQI